MAGKDIVEEIKKNRVMRYKKGMVKLLLNDAMLKG
jgi:hypothetical protein